MLQTKAVEKLETCVLCSVTIYRKSSRLCDVLKCYRAGQATDDNMAHAGYLRLKHTQKLCNTHCFSTATGAARTRLNVTRTLPALLRYISVPYFTCLVAMVQYLSQ